MSLARPGTPAGTDAAPPCPGPATRMPASPPLRPGRGYPLGDHATVNVKSEQAGPGVGAQLLARARLAARSGVVGRSAPLERVLLDEQVWAFRVGAATTVANLSSGPATRDTRPRRRFTVLASTSPERREHKVAGNSSSVPWEALVAGAAAQLTKQLVRRATRRLRGSPGTASAVPKATTMKRATVITCTTVQYSQRWPSWNSSTYSKQNTIPTTGYRAGQAQPADPGRTARQPQGLHRTSMTSDQTRPGTATGTPKGCE